MGTIFVDNLEPQSGTSLTLGASGDTLTIPSGCTISNSGTASGFGKVGQVQQSILSSTVSHNTNSFADLGVDVNITPSSTSSKILVFVNGYVGSDTATANVHFDVQRDSTTIIGDTVLRIANDSQATYRFYNIVFNWLDSPSTTSQVQYSLRARTNAGTMYLNRPGNQGGFPDIADSVITAMEILD